MLTRLANGLLDRHQERQLRREQSEHIASGRLAIGEHSYGLFRLTVQKGDPPDARVEIGRYCSIGQEVLFLPGGNHRLDWVSTSPFELDSGSPAPTRTVTRLPEGRSRSATTSGSDAGLGFSRG